MKTTTADNDSEPRSPGTASDQPQRTAGLSLTFYPNPVLRAICQPVERFDSTFRDLTVEMFSVMYLHSGVGLAGPQVSVVQRVLVCDIQGRQLCLTNPEILEAGHPGNYVEGCLSLPNMEISVTRPERIQVGGYDTTGRRIRFGATGLWARVIQHEIDHLNGVLICDRGKPAAQPCGPCSLALPAVLIEERKRRSQDTRAWK